MVIPPPERPIALWALADATLAAGQAERARAFAERFLAVVMPTEEPTWQAMAQEVRARVALSEDDRSTAAACVQAALDIVDQHGAPIAEWRVHRVAARLASMEGQEDVAQACFERAAHAAQRLLHTLPPTHALRHAFERLTAA
ncbi:hypothetical protein [Luteibacter sp. 3190]|uniref:hypothetical protein n=1 Tax=Luteibacter sp. 3190 TaxID=2817736 RepID=UPI0028624781|nr:hypothetical protein [Luteibacter sp. 3190]MDR6936001.1 ATP/maltotriose-dependent transcriptional regulator MalT [Luteibacter sp. 3190]